MVFFFKHPFVFRWLCLGAVFVFLACAVQRPAVDLSKFQSAVNSIPESWKKEPVVVLLDSTRVKPDFNNGKNSLRLENTQIVYVQKANPKFFEKIVVYRSETVEQTPAIKGEILYPDGSSKTIPGFSFKKVRMEEPGFYQSNQWAHFAGVPRYGKGILLRITTQRHYFRPEYKSQYPVRGNFPILRKKISLRIPDGASLNYGLNNPEGLRVDSAATVLNGGKEITFTFRQAEKINAGNSLKHPENWYASVYFCVPPVGKKSFTWTEMGDYYLNTIKKSVASSPQIKALAGQIKASGPDSIVDRAFTLLRERIRYHADEKDIYAIVPRPAGTILSQGYGDCKEMSTLLMVLLMEKGVSSGLALTMSEGNFQLREEYPGLNYFNHIILYYQGEDGILRYVDPTVKFGDSRSSYLSVNGQKALFLKPGASRVGKIQAEADFVNQVITRSRIDQSGKQWLLQGTIELQGLAAFRLQQALQNQTQEEEAGFLKTYLAEIFNLNSLSRKLENSSPSSIKISYTANFNNSYLKLGDGGLLLNAPSLYGGLNKFTTLEVEGPRYFEKLEQTDYWILPPEFSQLEGHAIEHDLATGTWSQGEGKITRQYNTRRKHIDNSARDVLKGYFESRNKLLKTTVWKP